MANSETLAFEQAVYRVVRHIPPGKVATYGQVALLAGRVNGARLTGRAMGHAPPGTPCHRVVGHGGRLAPGWPQQRTLLEEEGVTFLPSGRVNCRLHRWLLQE